MKSLSYFRIKRISPLGLNVKPYQDNKQIPRYLHKRSILSTTIQLNRNEQMFKYYFFDNLEGQNKMDLVRKITAWGINYRMVSLKFYDLLKEKAV